MIASRAPAGRSLKIESRLRRVLLALVLLAPLPFGCVEDWSRWLLITLLGVAFGVFLWRGPALILTRRERLSLGLGCLCLAWLGVQIVPLPPALLEAVSPSARRLYRIALPGRDAADPRGYAFPDPGSSPRAEQPEAIPWQAPEPATFRPISLHPYSTYRVLCQTGALICFVAMGLSLFRGRHRRSLAVALVIAGAAQASYGLFEALTGRQHIFLYQKRFYTDAATGTLVNRNHYAAMLNLVLPLVVAMLLDRRRTAAPSLRSLAARARLREMARTAAEPILISLAILMGIGVVLSRSRMGIASMMAGLLGLSAILAWRAARRRAARPDRKRWGPILLAATLPVILLSLIAVYSLGTDVDRTFRRFLLVPSDLQSTSVRPALWAETLPVIRQFLWTGAGAGAYAHALNPSLSHLPLNHFRHYDHAHSDYLEAAATLGILGLLPGAAALVSLCLRLPGSLLGLAALVGLGTLLLHSAFDFPLVVPSNALLACTLLCLVAPGSGGRGRGAPSPAAGGTGWGGWPQRAAAVAVFLALALGPARSLLAAAVYRPHWHAPPVSPAARRALAFASTLEPWNDFYLRAQAQGRLEDARNLPITRIELGEDLRQQHLRRSLDRIAALLTGYRPLLQNLERGPVDYELHAEIAQAVTEIRALARQAGIPIPGEGEPGSPLASPHLASVALAPTAYGNHAAMAGLLWQERAGLGPEGASMSLGLIGGDMGKPWMEPGWIGHLMDMTDDAPSLALLDRILRPPPGAYARLLDEGSRPIAPSMHRCAAALRTLAELRESAGSLGDGSGRDDPARLGRSRTRLAAIAGATAGAAPGPAVDPCEDGDPRFAGIAQEARRLLERIDQRLGRP